MKTLVIDDELLARNRIVKLLNESELIDSVFQASSRKEAVKMIERIKPSLVFLDIHMTDMTGFDVLKKLNNINNLPIIIFVTAFDNFAVKAFEVKAFDFLLKPFKKERFFEVLNKGVDKINFEKDRSFRLQNSKMTKFLVNKETDFIKEENDFLERIVLKTGNKYFFIKTCDIKYITSSAYYAEIFLKNNEKHIDRISMSDFIKRLDPMDFIRINRSTIVKLSEIKEIISEGMGDYSIVMNGNKSFVLTKNYKSDFLKILNIKK